MVPDSPPSRTSIERSALFVATLTSFMGPFMISAVNVALPSIQADLGLDAVQLSWVATAYLVAVAVGLIPAGRIADIHGRKRVFTTGLVVYTLSALAAAFVTTGFALIALRAVQGLGVSLFTTTGMAILTSIFPPERRGRALGIYVAAVYVGLSVGPFVGGQLTHLFGWRSIFLVMGPLGAGSIAVTLLFLKGEWAEARGQRFDLGGTLVYAASMIALACGASILPSVAGAVLLAASLLGFGLFFRLQIRSPHPVFEVSLLVENRVFAFSCLAALLNYSATFGTTFLMSLYLQYIKGFSPRDAGLVLIAQPTRLPLPASNHPVSHGRTQCPS